jgi:putative glutamine amidotransferase
MDGLIVIASAPREKPQNYARALQAVGVPEDRIRVLMPGELEAEEVKRLAARAAGLVLSGGPDIHPRYFDEEELPGANLSIEEDRDAMEWSLLEGAREARTPTWCVCRGMQIANTFLGGDLWQDLPSQVPGLLLHRLSFPGDALIHTIEVPAEADTWLGEVLGREMALVNSRHHQGVRRLAPGIANVGQAPDGLVEAISWTADDWWLHGVQWHPENLIAMEQERELWSRFVEATGSR